MGEHRPLGPAGGAARVEQPGDRVRIVLGHRHGIALEQPAVVDGAHLDDPLERLDARLERADGIDQVRRREADLGAGMAEDVLELARVQLGIDRHHGEAGVPAGEQQLDVFGHVLHHQRDPIARPQAEGLAEAPGHDRRPAHQPAVAQQHVGPERHGRPLRVPPTGANEQTGNVHLGAPWSSRLPGMTGASTIRTRQNAAPSGWTPTKRRRASPTSCTAGGGASPWPGRGLGEQCSIWISGCLCARALLVGARHPHLRRRSRPSSQHRALISACRGPLREHSRWPVQHSQPGREKISRSVNQIVDRFGVGFMVI